VNAALGFNGATVLILGRLRYITLGNVGVLAWMFVIDLLLIPPWGPPAPSSASSPASWSTNIVKQAGLGFGAGIGIADRRHTIVMIQLVVAVVALNLLTLAVAPSLPVGLAAVAVVTFAVLRLMGPALELGGMFPELSRIRVLSWLLR
jgi:hypothetical protein